MRRPLTPPLLLPDSVTTLVATTAPPAITTAWPSYQPGWSTTGTLLQGRWVKAVAGQGVVWCVGVCEEERIEWGGGGYCIIMCDANFKRLFLNVSFILGQDSATYTYMFYNSYPKKCIRGVTFIAVMKFSCRSKRVISVHVNNVTFQSTSLHLLTCYTLLLCQVCCRCSDLLERLYNKPLIRIDRVNTLLYTYVPNLSTIEVGGITTGFYSLGVSCTETMYAYTWHLLSWSSHITHTPTMCRLCGRASCI